VVAAALSIARRQRAALRAFVPPHDDHVQILLDQLGFEASGRDRHGRGIFRHALDELTAKPAPRREAWVLPLDAASHDRLVPELAGQTQAELFSASPMPHTLGSPVRKQAQASRGVLAEAPATRTIVFMLLGLFVAIWGIATLVS